MKFLKIGAAILLVGVVVAALLAPIGPMPGFLIGGEPTAVPASWGDTHSVHEIQLQVGNGPIGRTVIIWTVQQDGDLFVVGDPRRGWASGIGEGSPVRLLLQGKLYELQATPITQGKIEVLRAWLAKYAPDYPEIVEGFGAPEEGAKMAAVFRLTARS
ncbi:MAG: hypothetical protein RIC89_10815 [Pseudomonadales bacterium]